MVAIGDGNVLAILDWAGPSARICRRGSVHASARDRALPTLQHSPSYSRDRMASFKRARSPAVHEFSPPSSTSSSPTLKAARTSATPPPQPSTSTAAASHILCTLPPTCIHRPTSVAVHELQAHYARHHAHVCELGGCGCVFPDARFLELVSGSLHFAPSLGAHGAVSNYS